ncbi:unnamed protein product [Linum trigynum]|uniref:Uncharacterized protein n=1 Tax=Linum trigynum TaxID=586398 RepID=A0AAV2CVY9_9ROSI
MATNTSRIVDLETQMTAVQQKMDLQHQDLKSAIAELAASTKDNIDALSASLARLRDKSPSRSSPSGSQAPFTEAPPFSFSPSPSVIIGPLSPLRVLLFLWY